MSIQNEIETNKQDDEALDAEPLINDLDDDFPVENYDEYDE
jgi:hypothetical protein